MGYPILNTTEVMTEVARRAATFVLGEENILVPGLGMGGEDFVYCAMARPACCDRL